MKSKTASALALGASVSVLAFSIAAPAHAGTSAGISQSTSSADVNTTLTISNVGEDVLFGVDNSGAPSVSSSVTDSSTGQIFQYGTGTGTASTSGNAIIEMVNSGSATVRADAAASATSGAADARAAIRTGVSQFADGVNAASISLTNSGTLTIKSIASAEGATNGDADAGVDWGVYQYANSDAEATVSLANAGTLNVAVVADAQGASGDVRADAYLSIGVAQYAEARNDGDATVSLGNTSLLNITATANGDGASSADATAYVDRGISQTAQAYGGGNASITLANSGTINLTADATANAASAQATAMHNSSSDSDYIINQRANAYASGAPSSSTPSGNASVALTNASTGTINITANAEASGTASDAEAYAGVYGGVYQFAGSRDGDASATLTNAGSLNIAAAATANGATSASADASNDSAIQQYARAAEGGDASVTLANSGTLNLTATATAKGDVAEASADNDGGIYQSAEVYASGLPVDGHASVALTNASTGTINIAANARGEGTVGYGSADASNEGVISQFAGAGSGGASVELTNAGTFNVKATATADAEANADANATNEYVVRQGAGAGYGGNASVALANSGTLDITAIANATAGSYAEASATVDEAVFQEVYTGGGGDASATLANSGTLNLVADATAKGEVAYAVANNDGSSPFSVGGDYVIGQQAFAYSSGSLSSTPSGNASVTLTNASTGTINITANARGEGTVGYGSAYADNSDVIYQRANSQNGDASVTLTNAGSLNVTAGAIAIGATSASAGAGNGNVIIQHAYADNGGSVSLALANSGKLNIAATADAAAGTDADARAFIYNAVVQSGEANTGAAVAATLTNSGSLNLLADATANGTSADAEVGNQGGLLQNVRAFGSSTASAGNASVTLTNASTGTINVGSSASGAGTDGDGNAGAFVGGAVVQQAASEGGNASAALDNSGKINVNANVTASGLNADASAYIQPAIVQIADAAFSMPSSAVGGDASVTLTNASSGAIKVVSDAAASGDAASGYAVAIGAQQTGNGATVNLAVANRGAFTVEAVADAAGTSTGNAFAGAAGYQASNNSSYFSGSAFAPVLNFANSGTFAVSAKATGTTAAEANAVGAVFQGDVLSGQITNAGQLTVVANADAPTGAATAAGIYLVSAENTVTLTNTGTISASALTTEGTSVAKAILVEGAFAPFSAGYSALAVNEFTINNSGSIVARQSIDGATTWTHGLAIDTTNAPTAAVINLTGNGATPGSIYGNIDISAIDVINVASGETQFDGVVNPGGELEGQLNILSGGRLYLQNAPTANPSYDGPAQVNVDALTIAAGGTLALQLPNAPSGGATYPAITANTANITGATLEVRPATANGLFADSAAFPDIIVAGDLTGTFASAVTTTGTPLLNFTPTYSGGNISLNMTRVAFNAVSGLSTNQNSVATGIETVYNDTLTGPTAALLGTLFTQNSAAYAASLDQLTGAQYASHLQSLIRLGGRFNDLLADAGDCAATTEFRQSCRAESGGRIWGKIDYGRVTKDGDVNASGYYANDWYLALGTDYNVAPNVAVGVGVAYVSHNETFKRNYGEIKSDGFQVGAYAVYDPGQYFFEGVVSYSGLNADSTRSVNIGATRGTLRGSPNADIWAVSGQTGYRLSAGDKSVVTPYFNLDFVSAKMKGFTETGVAAANLVVGSNTHEAWATTFGAKWGGAFRGVVPELNLGWRHQFGDRVALVDAAFGALPGSDFQIISQTEKRDSALVGLSINGKASPMAEFRVEYLGQFNSEFQSHGGGVTLTVRFGG